MLAVAGAASGLVSGGISAIMGGKARRDAERRQRALLRQIKSLENRRQDIIDPFAGVSSMLTNPFANLPVATQAAEFQAQQTDLSLASTLDTLRATGAGAGGATALAQAALQAKQGVSASIAQQEVQNARLRAQGQARLESQLAEAEVKGKQFVFKAQEAREMQKLNRLSALAGAASQQAAAAQSAELAGIGQAAGSLGSLATIGATGGFSSQAPSPGLTGNVPGTGNFGSAYNFQGSIDPNLVQIPALQYNPSTQISSDRRLKNNIKQIGRSPSGLKIYSFEYKNKKGLYQGVMSDEIPSNAVIVGNDGFDMVDYSKIDVEFKLIK